ncbi:beta-L-arabinofuranosidase domain-containing protein [Desulfobacula sp.]|uniref:beta-L-arabinofuranosidase domain-containing protein n=1 Tax=Desulfobacula sp. TaxID=2593537 RepID=UPI0026271D1B|nr:beta-L-arabinofuranosidase domain-containing protein [Desulfobacula sp.]
MNLLRFITLLLVGQLFVLDVHANESIINQELIKKIEKSYCLAENWFINNIKEDGSFNYLYDPLSRKYSKKNNMIRQLMASRLLAELSHERDELKNLHKRNLKAIFKFWYKIDDKGRGFIIFNGKSKLGANAMALRTILYSPFYAKYQKQTHQLLKTILSAVNNDYSLQPWFVEPPYSYNHDYLLTFYSGEAILSLAEYYSKTEDPQILKIAIKIQDYYIEKYVNQMDYNYYPAYVPWHTMSMFKLFELTGDKNYIDAIFKLNNKLLKLLDTNEFVGRFYNKEYPFYGKPHSSSDGVYTESIAYALKAALIMKNKNLIQFYKNSIELSYQNLSSLQYTETNLYSNDYLVGSFKIKKSSDIVRLDSNQHIMDAYRAILSIGTGVN